MKKFLIFLVATIVAVCIGITFYQFAKNDEVIKVNAQTIYINYGDKLSLDDIGFSRKEASKDTKINFNAGGDEVTSIIKYDELTKCYIPTQKGGATTIKISTTNRKYKTLTIDVIVGIGTEENPYYISNETQLFNIGNTYGLGSYYELVNDINLSKTHYPIGLIDGKYNEFSGKFNGNYHKINNLKINECDNAGLFATLGATSEIYNLSVTNPVFAGSFLNVGTISGICYGTINKVVVENPSITNTRASGNTGAIVGYLATDRTVGSSAGILRTGAYSTESAEISSKGNLGGIAGYVDSAIIHACYTDVNLKNTAGVTGGIAGEFVVDDNTYMRESYSISKIQSTGKHAGNIIGKISISNNANSINQELVLVGLYFNKSINTYAGIGADPYNFATATSFAVSGKTTAELKTKTTYIYYINSGNDVIYWDKVWSLVDGEYPILTFVSKFDDVNLEGDSSSTAPDDENQNSNNNPDLTDPDEPNANIISITTKQELLTAFQTGNTVTGNYVLGADINLEGMLWTPVAFSGRFVSDSSTNHTISNFKIEATTLYSGFFSKLSSATISGIRFSNVTITNSTTNECIGIVVGYISGTTSIKNVSVANATISASSKYVGFISGYIGNAAVKIESCSAINSKIEGNILYTGGISARAGAYTIIDKCKTSGVILKAIERIGGIAAINYGVLSNCNVAGQIQSVSTSSTAGYFGGLCGVNLGEGKISESISLTEIAVLNNSDKSKGIFYYVGGICGYNKSTISRCATYANNISAANPSAAIHIGGLTGYNTGAVEYCYGNIETIGETRTNIYVGGLSAYNYGGSIYGCWVNIKNLNGYVVAGLVRINTNNGTVDSCISAGATLDHRSTFKGVHTVGFVYDMVSGTISNCLVKANLTCSYDSGWMAGIAGFMPYINGTYGTITTSIADVSFSGKGIKYLELAEDGLMKKTRTTGTISHCVISKDAIVEGVYISEYDNEFLFWGEANPGSKSNYIVATEAEMKNIETYLDSKKCNFDITSGNLESKWVISNNSMPKPRAILSVFTGAAG